MHSALQAGDNLVTTGTLLQVDGCPGKGSGAMNDGKGISLSLLLFQSFQ